MNNLYVVVMYVSVKLNDLQSLYDFALNCIPSAVKGLIGISEQSHKYVLYLKFECSIVKRHPWNVLADKGTNISSF